MPAVIKSGAKSRANRAKRAKAVDGRWGRIKADFVKEVGSRTIAGSPTNDPKIPILAPQMMYLIKISWGKHGL